MFSHRLFYTILLRLKLLSDAVLWQLKLRIAPNSGIREKESDIKTLQRCLNHITGRSWFILRRGATEATLQLTTPIAPLPDSAYNDYVQQLKAIARNFYVDARREIKCTIGYRDIKRLVALLERHSQKLRHAINVGVKPQ